MSTIGSLVNHGITLGAVTQNGTYASPLTITGTGYVDNTASGDAVFGPNTAAWYVANQGTITATKGNGIDLKAGGTVFNSGHITGAGVNTSVGPGFAGVYIGGTAGLVVNSGTISGPAGVDLYAGGTVIDSGVITGAGLALFMDQPGYVSIASTGTVSGGIGVEIANLFQAIGPSTVINSGTIIGSQYFASPGRYFGAYIGSGGTLVNNAGGTISGMVFANRGPLTVFDYGTISSPKGPAIYLYDGGTVTIGNFTNGATASPAQVIGGIDLKQAGATVNIGSNGTVHGTIQALTNPATIIDYGTISNPGSTGIYLGGGGTVIIGNQIVGAASGVSGAGGTRTEADCVADVIFSLLFGASVDIGTFTNFADVTGHIKGFTRTTNASSGAVSSAAATGGSAAIVNYGTMQAATGYAIDFDGLQATIANGAATFTSALISGSFAGIGILDAPGTVRNFGKIVGTAGTGVILAAGSTLTNAGSIVGQGGTAVQMLGTSGNRVVVDPGGYFKGVVLGGAGTVELAVGNGAAGTLSGFGPTITNFSTLEFDSGAKWTAEGSAAGFPAAIDGFAAGDTIDVDGFIAVNDSYNGTGLVLTDALSNTVTLGIEGIFTTGDFTVLPDTRGGTDVTTAVCLCRGTMILTDAGEVPVEDLAVGDLVVTVSGVVRPIQWIGFGRDEVTRGNKLARPVVVRAGALADGVPVRDLHLTHGHALYLHDVLIPVENLVNHRSILWDDKARSVEYYHIELAAHDVVLADGAPVETYYDAGNRASFSNTRPFSRIGATPPTFAPVLNGGDLVEQAWAELFARAGGAIEDDTTDDPDLHLVVDGRRLDPKVGEDGAYRFALEAPAAALRLCSRSGVPSLLGISRHDHRRLGVALGHITVRQAGTETRVDNDAPLLRESGCHPAESGYAWTDGELELPARLFAHLRGALTLSVHMERPGMRYPLAATLAQAA